MSWNSWAVFRVTSATVRLGFNSSGLKKMARSLSRLPCWSICATLISCTTVSMPGKLVWMRMVLNDDTISKGGVLR